MTRWPCRSACRASKPLSIAFSAAPRAAPYWQRTGGGWPMLGGAPPAGQPLVPSEPREGALLELAGLGLGDAQLAGRLAHRDGRLAAGAETQLDHAALILRQSGKRGVDRHF